MTEFNDRPLTQFAATMAKLMDVEIPKQADTNYVDEVIKAVKEKTGKETVDKMLIYNPDAIGQWFFEKYNHYFEPLKPYLDIRVDYLTAFPPKTPVCFGTMFTGATPEVHGIQAYVKPVITIDTLFDSLRRANKKVAMVAIKGQSIPKIYANRDIDYYLLNYDKPVVGKALELIENSDYDVIEVYNQQYDDIMHMTHPKSIFAKKAAKNYVKYFVKLAEAVKKHWAEYNTFMTFAPDHGTHREWYGLGQHGKNIPKDMNLTHLYGVNVKK